MKCFRTPTTAVLLVSLLQAVSAGRLFKRASDNNVGVTDNMKRLWRQLMLEQHAQEERVRSEGDSGLKQVRLFNRGYRSWASSSHVDASEIASIHSHADHERTVGLGEFVAVLNGVEFRTRHNDYLLKRPSTKPNSAYHEVEDIEYPDVPPSVLRQSSVEAQAQEMREYFKAFQNDDSTHRDFQNYFKPILCYLEGAWHIVNDSLEEPFVSDRHFIDARSWYDLHQKNIFLAASGRKDPAENLAHLPTKVIGVNNDGTAEIAQWNYRILCHEIHETEEFDYLHPSQLKVVQEMKPRMQSVVSLNKFNQSRQARFHVLPSNGDERNDGFLVQSPLQKLMAQVPGKDNYYGDLRDNVDKNTVHNVWNKEPLNTAYYHSSYSLGEADAMGLELAARGFSDASVHMAMTSRQQVAAFEWDICDWDEEAGEDVCNEKLSQRWTYAIPLEIIYLTPLHKWNPYNLEHRGKKDSQEGEKVEQEGLRFGGFTEDTAFDGTHDRAYYRVPSLFFQSTELQDDPADTNAGVVGVLDRNGVVQNVTASGVRVLQPNIPGVGVVRQRYPVMPLYKEGDATWKELEALKDYTLELIDTYLKDEESEESSGMLLRLRPSTKITSQHDHTAIISWAQVDQLEEGEQITVVTSQESGHVHELVIAYDYEMDAIVIASCDFEPSCFDGHPAQLISPETDKRKRRSLKQKLH